MASCREDFERRWEDGGGEEEQIKDLWLSQKEDKRKKKAQHIPEIFSAVLEYAWCSQIQAHKAWICVCVARAHTKKHLPGLK